MILQKAKKVAKSMLAIDTTESLNETMKKLNDIQLPDLSDEDTVIVCTPTDDDDEIFCNDNETYVRKADDQPAAPGGRLARGES